MRFDFEFQISFFSDPKDESICLCSLNMQNLAACFPIGNSDGPSRQVLGPKSDDLGHQIIESKNGMVSHLNTSPTTTSSSRTIDELDGNTAG